MSARIRYGVVNVVPRSWTHLLGVALGREVDVTAKIDESWCATAEQISTQVHSDYARPPVDVMGDGGDVDYQPWDGDAGQEPLEGVSATAQRQTDRAILATRRAVYPLHGLDPEDPRD